MIATIRKAREKLRPIIEQQAITFGDSSRAFRN
jgi:hypothetical protein